MINHPCYAVEPWALRETEVVLEMLAHSESVLALANGHLGVRGTFEEGEPRALPGTYLAGFHEDRPLPYAEAGYGYPESGETVVNVTDGKVVRLLAEDEPLDLRYGSVRAHERVLDFRSGTLDRRTEWISPTGRALRVTSRRLVSFAQRAVAAIEYEVEPLDGAMWIVLQSELLANEPLPAVAGDPRAAAALRAPLVPDLAVCRGSRGVLAHHTERSGLRLAAGMDHVVSGPEGLEATIEAADDLARLTVVARVARGERLRLVKFLAYGWSSQRSTPALRAQVDAALTAAGGMGWDGLAAAQRAFLDDFWARADIELEGDPEIQQALRFALFHVLQAGARGEQRAIPAKGLTGPGYDGHTFWDSETFVLPVLTYTIPEAARDALHWRHATLDQARDRARVLGQRGAAFPWRTISGRECSAYWPAGTAAFHVGADVADATARYLAATGDRDFERECGAELLVETARLWAALGHHDADGRFRIDGVTGPDEYTAVVDDNAYTNLMAQRNLHAAAEVAERRPEIAAALGVGGPELESWRAAADHMVVPYDDDLGVHAQSEGFTSHALWDFAATPPDKYPLLLHYPYFDLYRKQVVKQADLVLAMHLRGDAFTPEQKARNFDYYERLTVRDSSLSACTQAVVAAEVGHLELAYDYLAEAALVDIDDLKGNVRDGVHIASLAGAWLAVVAGFGGMRDHGGALTFAPRLPPTLNRLAFRLVYLGRHLLVEVRSGDGTYTLLHGDSLETAHHGEAITVVRGTPVTRPIPQLPDVEPPRQPPGRAPARRGVPPV